MHRVSIAYYAHHHGSGHIRRALAIARHMDRPLAIFSSAAYPEHDGFHDSDRVSFHGLPPDTHAAQIPTQTTVSGLHYAPLGIRGINDRMGIIAEWARSQWPCLLVVDVSVEVALLARLCAIPTIYIRQNGDRTDLPHVLAYESAVKLISPFPEAFGRFASQDVWEKKTAYTGFISRYANTSSKVRPLARTIAVLIGRGGTSISVEQVCAAARATPEWTWLVVGPVDGRTDVTLPLNMRLLGVVPDPLPHLGQAEIVVGSAGDNVVAEMAHLGCRYIALSQARPFEEQRFTAKTLEQLGAAIHCDTWPEASAWPELLQRAAALDTQNWNSLTLDDGAMNAAHLIQDVADQTWRISNKEIAP